MSTGFLLRLAVAIAWVGAPPILIVSALRGWNVTAAGARSRRLTLLGLASLINWLAFPLGLALGQIGGFGSHYLPSPLLLIFVVVAMGLLGLSLAAVAGRKIVIANALVFALWSGSMMVA